MTERVIVIFPDFENVGVLDEIRARFDPLAASIRPHISLVFTFTSSLSTGELRTHMEAALRECQPFRVLLRDVTGHEGEYLFLNVKRGNDALIDLHDRLYTGCLAGFLRRDLTYLPHLTVGRVPPSRFGEAVQAVLSMDASFSTTVQAVTVYAIEPDARGAVEFTVPLGPR